MFEFTEKTYVDSIWYISDKETGDWMGCIYRQDDGPWVFRYRFRYYKDHKAFESDDEKHWYSYTSPEDINSDEALNQVRTAMTGLKPIMEAKYGGEMDVVELQCKTTDPKFFFEFTSRGWCHIETGRKAEEILARQSDGVPEVLPPG
jgi:hypothetical protein